MMKRENYMNLESALISAGSNVEKMKCMVERLCEYFSLQDIKTDTEKQHDVIFEYDEMRVFTDITLDYINKLNSNLNAAFENLENAHKESTQR